MFSGATGNHPEPVHPRRDPLMCSARFGHLSLYATYAYVGDPPVRSGIIADSSANRRQRR